MSVRGGGWKARQNSIRPWRFARVTIAPMLRSMGILLTVISAAWGADAAPDRIRDAATKGLALLQFSQKDWFAKQSCASCHHQVLPALAVREAREHGIPLNQDIANADAAKGFSFFSDLDRAVQYNYIIDPALDDGYMLLAAHAVGVAPNLVAAVYARHLAATQRPDGHWVTMDARPPQSSSSVTATAVALRAIQLYGHPSLAAETKARIERAQDWLAAVKARDTEEKAYQLFGLQWTGAERGLLDRLARELAAAQQSDGGWAALDGRQSDAYSTGQVLVALRDAGGLPASDPVWRRGIEFLLSSQAADGSWHVRSRLYPPAQLSPPYFETGYPYGHDQFVSAMAASWAVRALSSASGAASRRIEILAPPETLPKDLEPWMETVLFGSVADLRQALDRGLDPNAATKTGGTTALMLAQPDIEKTRLLLDRGAKINARSKSKYSALLTASTYPNAAPVMRLLLDRGAEVRMAKGQGAPMFNASEMVLASAVGNAEIIPRLRQAGESVDSKMIILGMFPGTAAAQAVSFGDTATLRALLDNGVSANETDQNGDTLLNFAVYPNHVEVAQLLLERGADVNHVDPRGMTALLYAASTDFGDPSMVQLLLKMGANSNAKNKEGLTALDLARKYGHAYLFTSLLAKN